MIDLTHTISEKSPNYEGSEKSPFEARQMGHIEKDGYFSRYISLPEHFSTHIDAPAHFSKNGWTVDQIPPEHLVGPLVLLNVAEKCRNNADYEITPADLTAWEKKHGRVPAGAIVMANTGWASRWNSMKDYRNADAKGAMHFPGFRIETVKLLVDERKIVGMAIDTMGMDYGASTDYPVHRYTSSHNVYHLENVADMSAVPESGATLLAAPAKLEGGSGGPVRILVLLK